MGGWWWWCVCVWWVRGWVGRGGLGGCAERLPPIHLGLAAPGHPPSPRRPAPLLAGGDSGRDGPVPGQPADRAGHTPAHRAAPAARAARVFDAQAGRWRHARQHAAQPRRQPPWRRPVCCWTAHPGGSGGAGRCGRFGARPHFRTSCGRAAACSSRAAAACADYCASSNRQQARIGALTSSQHPTPWRWIKRKLGQQHPGERKRAVGLAPRCGHRAGQPAAAARVTCCDSFGTSTCTVIDQTAGNKNEPDALPCRRRGTAACRLPFLLRRCPLHPCFGCLPSHDKGQARLASPGCITSPRGEERASAAVSRVHTLAQRTHTRLARIVVAVGGGGGGGGWRVRRVARAGAA